MIKKEKNFMTTLDYVIEGKISHYEWINGKTAKDYESEVKAERTHQRILNMIAVEREFLN